MLVVRCAGGIEQRIDELLRVYQSEMGSSDPLYVELEAHGSFRGFIEPHLHGT